MLAWILCVIFIGTAAVLGIKVWFLKKGMAEVERQLEKRLQEDTNNPIYVSTGDVQVRKLADSLNVQLRILKEGRHRYQHGDTELKEAVTNISHDLRTPLTAIGGYLDLLLQEEISPEVRQYLELIGNRTEVMKELTEELFRYSVITSVQELEYTDAVLNQVLEESLISCYGAFSQKQIVPEIILPEIQVFRRLDVSALNRIFGNILSNVLKYSDGDLQVVMDMQGRITFSNQAKNMTPLMAERLFDRFYTVETGRNSTGLGLAIAKVLTERMGGTIDAKCAEERLTVTVYFPEILR